MSLMDRAISDAAIINSKPFSALHFFGMIISGEEIERMHRIRNGQLSETFVLFYSAIETNSDLFLNVSSTLLKNLKAPFLSAFQWQ